MPNKKTVKYHKKNPKPTVADLIFSPPLMTKRKLNLKRKGNDCIIMPSQEKFNTDHRLDH